LSHETVSFLQRFSFCKLLILPVAGLTALFLRLIAGRDRLALVKGFFQLAQTKPEAGAEGQ
jgi:hypothetical protein